MQCFSEGGRLAGEGELIHILQKAIDETMNYPFYQSLDTKIKKAIRSSIVAELRKNAKTSLNTRCFGKRFGIQVEGDADSGDVFIPKSTTVNFPDLFYDCELVKECIKTALLEQLKPDKKNISDKASTIFDTLTKLSGSNDSTLKGCLLRS